MYRPTAIRLGIILGLLFFCSGLVLGQGVSARLEGVVKDQSGGVIPGVVVVATKQDTNLPHEALSNEAGRYVFPNLPAGDYEITAELEGFKKVVQSGIILQIGDARSLDLTLEAGDISQTVTVTGQASLINSSDTKVGAVIGTEQAVDLPLNGRNAMHLVFLQAGTSPLDRLPTTSTGTGHPQQSGAVDGLAPHTSIIQIEGITSSNPGYDYNPSHPSTPVPQEAVGEYRVTTSGDSASTGRGSGAQVKVLLKSGTNEFHGSLFEFHRNRVLNANNFFNNRSGSNRPFLIRNQFGGSIGGPIIKDRTFFFTTLEWQRQSQARVINRFVYTPELRTGIFRFYNKGSNSGGLVDADGAPTVPAADIGTIDLVNVDPTRIGFDTFWLPKLLAVMPNPNNYDIGDGFNTAGFRFNDSRRQDINQLMFKIDHRLTDNHNLAGSFADWTLRDPNPKLLNGISPEDFEETRAGGSLRLISSFTPTFTNELSLGANLRRAFRVVTNPEQETFPPGNIQFVGLGSGRDSTGNLHILRGTQNNPAVNTGFSDNFSWVRGNHTFNFGGEFWRMTLNRQVGVGHFPISRTDNASNPASIPALPGLSGGDRNRAAQLTNDLTGTIGSVNQTFYLTNEVELTPFTNTYQAANKIEWSIFFQDIWRIRPGFTLNLGMRFDVMPPVAVDNVFGYPVGGVAGALGVQGPTGQPTQWAADPDQGRNIFATDYNNFGPHLGFTWDPFGDGKTAISGSYRVSFDRFMIAVGANFSRQNFGTSTGTTLTPFARLSDTDYFTGGVLPIPLPPIFPSLGNVRLSRAYAVDPDLAVPYVQGWSIGFERELAQDWKLDINYVGNHAVGMWRANNFNQVDIRNNGFLNAFQIAQANLAANGDPTVGADLGALAPLFGLVPSSQFFLITQGQAGSLANFLDTTSGFGAGVRGGLVAQAGLPDTFFRFNPQVLNLNIVGNGSHSTWHGLKSTLNRRFNDGLYLQANYTLSKGLTGNVPGQTLYNPDYRDNSNFAIDKGFSQFDSTHVVGINWLWDLPFGQGKRFLNSASGVTNTLLGNWQLNGIYDFTTGRPFRTHTGRRFLNQNREGTPNFSGGFSNLSSVDKGAIVTVLTPEKRAAFSNPGAGEVGGLPQYKFHGPSFTTLDMSIFKTVPLRVISEDAALQFRVEFFNILNHPTFEVPRWGGNNFGNINSGSFGTINAAFPERIGQFGIKLVFEEEEDEE